MPPAVTTLAYDNLLPSVNINVMDFLSRHVIPDLAVLAPNDREILLLPILIFRRPLKILTFSKPSVPSLIPVLK